MRRIMAVLMAAVLTVTCAAGASPRKTSPVAGKKVAYIM